MRTCHVQMCPLFRISETAGRIVLKFGVPLENRQLGVLQKPTVGYSCTCARAHPFFRISETAGQIDLKLGRYTLRDPLDKRFIERPIS